MKLVEVGYLTEKSQENSFVYNLWQEYGNGTAKQGDIGKYHLKNSY